MSTEDGKIGKFKLPENMTADGQNEFTVNLNSTSSTALPGTYRFQTPDGEEHVVIIKANE